MVKVCSECSLEGLFFQFIPAIRLSNLIRRVAATHSSGDCNKPTGEQNE
jgi:hypothetical protein